MPFEEFVPVLMLIAFDSHELPARNVREQKSGGSRNLTDTKSRRGMAPVQYSVPRDMEGPFFQKRILIQSLYNAYTTAIYSLYNSLVCEACFSNPCSHPPLRALATARPSSRTIGGRRRLTAAGPGPESTSVTEAVLLRVGSV